MTFTYVLTQPRGQVRLLIKDTVIGTAVFTDEELDALLLMEASNVKRSAALALETMASNDAYVLKVVKLLDITTDGARVSDALLKRAAELRAQADFEDAGTDGGFDVAEMVLDDFSFRERVIDDGLRAG